MKGYLSIEMSTTISRETQLSCHTKQPASCMDNESNEQNQ